MVMSVGGIGAVDRSMVKAPEPAKKPKENERLEAPPPKAKEAPPPEAQTNMMVKSGGDEEAKEGEKAGDRGQKVDMAA
jgi:hypothetical protein